MILQSCPDEPAAVQMHVSWDNVDVRTYKQPKYGVFELELGGKVGTDRKKSKLERKNSAGCIRAVAVPWTDRANKHHLGSSLIMVKIR